MSTTTFQAVLDQYEKNKNTTSGNKVSNEERMKKYFTTVLEKENSGEKRIRILPTKDGSSPFVEVKFHELQVDGKWLKLYDPEQEGKPSPLNEVRQGLLDSGEEEDIKLARAYRSRTFYIVKLIDRDNEQDGPKFWRFKHNIKGEGIFDKIIPIFRNKGDITDPIKGRDLILSLSKTKANNGNYYTIVNAIINEDISPLHEDENIAKEWIDDDLIWSNVYSIKGQDYLELVAKGETPKWDNDKKQYVADSTITEEEQIGGKKGNELKKEMIEISDPQDDELPDEELPF